MKFFKRLALIFITFLLCVLAVGTVFAYFYEDEIGARVVKELSKQLATDLQVKKVELSVFSDFPEAAINLENVRLEDTRKKDLLEAERLGFRFSLLSLFFGDNIQVHSVVVESGTLNLHIDRRGRGNFNILKSSPDSSSTDDNSSESQGFAISLDEAVLQDILLRYQDDRSKQKVKTRIKNAQFAGEISSAKFTVESEAELFLHYLQAANDRYLEERKVGYTAKVEVDMNAGTYDFERVSLLVNDNEYIVDGHLEEQGESLMTDILLTSDDASLESVIQLLPEQYLAYFEDFTSTGNFDFELWVKGKYKAGEYPGIEAKFGLREGEIRSPKLQDPLRNVSFTASFTNGQYRNNKTSVFQISEFKGLFLRRPISLNFMVYDFDEMNIDLAVDGALPLESVYGLFNSPQITDGSGEVRIRNLKVEGKYEDMRSMYAVEKVKTSGTAIFEDASLVFKKELLSIEEGEVRLDGNTLKVNELTVIGADSDIQFDGIFYNVLPVLFADKDNEKKAELEFDSALKSRKLNLRALSDLLTAAAAPEEYDVADGRIASNDSLQMKGVKQREHLTDFLKGKFEADVLNFVYDEIEGENFKGILDFNNNEVGVRGRSDGMGGVFDLDGTVVFTDRPYLKAKLICDQVNLKEFFRQSKNFGQEVLQDKHLDGSVSSKMLIQAYFDEENNFLEDKLYVLAGIGIKEGYLRDFKMLDAFSDYVKIEDLRNIRFTDLKNWLEIRNGHIFLPAMFIQSNALNMNMSGEYTFEHDLDFNVQVNAGQILINSFKKHDKSLKAQPAKKKGFFNLYYKIFGNIDDFEYEMNRREVKRDIERSEHRKREIRVSLRREFGDLKLFETPADWEDEDED